MEACANLERVGILHTRRLAYNMEYDRMYTSDLDFSFVEKNYASPGRHSVQAGCP